MVSPPLTRLCRPCRNDPDALSTGRVSDNQDAISGHSDHYKSLLTIVATPVFASIAERVIKHPSGLIKTHVVPNDI
jgi:hypothetical protein